MAQLSQSSQLSQFKTAEDNGVIEVEDNGFYFVIPTVTPHHVGQFVFVDWSRVEAELRPIDVPVMRYIVITHIEHEHPQLFSYKTIVSDDDPLTISAKMNEHTFGSTMCFDNRGGWTEMRQCPLQSRIMSFSHPVLKFID